MKKINYRHFIGFALLATSVTISILCFPYAFGRLLESFKDFGTSCAYYWDFMIDKPSTVIPTVTNKTNMPFVLPWNLPNTWEEFKVAWSAYWNLWASKANFSAYVSHLADVLTNFCKIALILMPIVLVLVLVKALAYSQVNNDYNQDTTALVRWKRFVDKVCKPVKAWFVVLFNFFKEHKAWIRLCFVVWAFSFNFFSIVIEFVAFYFYFIASFVFTDVYGQIVKLIFDLSPMLDFLPGIVWLVATIWLVNRIRRNVGYNRLNHMEMKNRGMLNSMPIVAMWCGTMGKGKTTSLTSSSLSWEIMFRDKAFELMLETDMKFPYFPWINFEVALRKAMAKHSVYNLATCRRFVRSKMLKFYRKPYQCNIFDYDFERYGTTFNDELKMIDIWKALEDYAQLYFIYVVESSLIISNYSVRTDLVMQDAGNLPLWNTDLFQRRPELSQAYSKRSHILDFDCLRLGKKMIENNKLANSFEFGVVSITEIGKERGNMLENKHKKKTDAETNQLNDLFNSTLKMIRHAGTVCNFCFVRVLLDEQRPESWGSDGKELADVVFIKEKSEMRLAMPLFLEELFLDWFLNKFRSKYSEYRYEHGNNTLGMHLYHGIASLLYNYRLRTYNTFGYQTWDIQVTSGRNESEYEIKNYYLLYKKDYADRFASDAYSDFYVTKSLDSEYGINDLPAYQATKATVDEFKQQNSYFMTDLFTGLFPEQSEEEKKKE